MLKNLKVRSKLFFSFSIVILFYIIAIIASSIGLGSVFGGLENFYKVPYPMVKYALQAQSTTRQVQLTVFRASAAGDDSAIQSYLSEIDQGVTQLSSALDSLAECYEGDAALLQSMQAAAQDTSTARSKTIECLENNDLEGAVELTTGEYAEASANMQSRLQEIIENAQAKADEYYTSGSTTKKYCNYILYGLAVVSVILTLFLSISIIRGITYPIAEIEHAVVAMAKGDMHSEVTYQSKDELGVLAENLRFVLKTLSEYISHICSRLDSLADGDLSVEMDMDYLGEFASIKNSGNKIIHSLNDTLGQIHVAADQVSSGSDQVSSGAQALSQGATEQASSVEELVATLSTLSEQVNQTAANSRDVNNLILETAGEVNNSNSKMEAMMTAMTKINECSSEIEKIIKTIEDIAFQTNILALNAAVEAARAGESGKGFAVVADEVRTLASRSAEAAKDTTVLISNSLTAVAEGNEIAADTQKSLLNVVTSAQQIETNMAQITEASDMQAEGLQQVTLGIDQISSVIQTNSATAQQSAAASEELFSQSTLLKNLVNRFHLKGMSASAFTSPSSDPASVASATSTDFSLSAESSSPSYTDSTSPIYSTVGEVDLSLADSSPVPEEKASYTPAPTVPFVNNNDKY